MRNIEVLEPYPNEILYSWLSRMFSWYGYHNNPKSNIREFNMILFGVNSRSINNILMPHKLQELIENISLNNSEYFNTAETLIQQTTIIPFYLAFLNKTVQKKVIEDLIHNGPMNITKSILGLKDLHSLSSAFKLKFCYKCWVESSKMFFDLEHQVKNNYICYKHNTRLQYILINSNEYFLFNNTCINEYLDAPYCIAQNERFDWNMELNARYDEFDVVEVIDNRHIMIKHKICNEIWPLLNKVACPNCSNINRYNKYKNMVEELTNEYDFINQDPKDSSRIIVLHKECNTPSSIAIVNFKSGQRCTKCKFINNFKKKIYNLVGDEYLLLNYEVGKKKSVFLHNDPNCMKKIYASNNVFFRL